ncbi:ABC transporter permease [Actinophytocola sp.]|uniref:ABC transporter permease n=1 Tax=Actinophytocola sp. TaxID=1872138 RepID=UPI002D7F21FF|nr:ABC transporter permease [Actinophytocola sp.]HET9139941.1 ABC transporter permease [Actinophytocola sp.]
MTGMRPALRIARREALAAKGRSVLVVALIMVPVAAVTFLSIAWDSFELTVGERADRQMGAAAAVVSWPGENPVRQLPDHAIAFPVDSTKPPGSGAASDDRLRALLPPGTRFIRDQDGNLTVHTASGIGTITTRSLDYADPLAVGIYRPLQGRAPAAADEIALTPAASDRLGAGVGGTVRPADGGPTLRVVAIVEDPGDLAATTIVRPSQAAGATDRADLRWLVATPNPMTWQQVKELNTHGLVAVSRQVLENPPSGAERYEMDVGVREGGEVDRGVLTLVAGFAMLEIILLAGPAFAVSARRRRRDLAMVAATGGTPAQVRRIMLADGLVLGSVAAVAGAGLGIAAAALALPLAEQAEGIRTEGLRVAAVPVLVIIALAVLTGTLAAVVPAWISGRQDVVAALAGRRGIVRSRRRWPILGLVLVAGGAGLAVLGASQVNQILILAALIVTELGLVLCTPALLGFLARLGRVLPLAPRMALRDTARNRTAAAPAISAVMAAVIGSIVISITLLAAQGQEAAENAGRPGDVVVGYADDLPGNNRPLPPDALDTLRRVMPVAAVAEINLPQCGGRKCFVRAKIPDARACPYTMDRLEREPTAEEQRAARGDARCAGVGQAHTYFDTIGGIWGPAFIIDENAVSTIIEIPEQDRDQVVAALRGGAVVVDDERYLDNGRVTLSVEEPATDRRARTLTAAGFVLPHKPEAPIVLLTEATARSLGLDSAPLVTLASTTRMPTVAEHDRLQAELGSEYRVTVDRGAEPDTQELLVLAIVAGLIAVGTAVFATGLTAADGRADLGTLAAVGAAPRLRRVLMLSQSGLIAGLGSVLGAIAGLGASVAVLSALNQRYAATWPAPPPLPITVPWLNLAVAVLIVPAVAMLGTGLLTRSRLPIERRR